MRYSTGQPIRLSFTVRDITGALVSPGAATLTVLKPDATQQAYSALTSDGTGLLHQDIPVTDMGQVGHYQYKLTTTGAGAGEQPGEFDVYDPFEVAVLSLQDGKDALNIPQATTTSDTAISGYIATIESNLERMTGGPIVNRTITAERAVLTGAYTILQVRQRPLVSVTSIVSIASGTAIDISAGLDIDPLAGTIRRKLGYPFYGPYFTWLPAMAITYVAGWGTAVPAAFSTASRIILQNLWETRRGPAGRPSMNVDEAMVTLPGFGFAIPNQAAELLNGSQNGMPFMVEAYV